MPNLAASGAKWFSEWKRVEDRAHDPNGSARRRGILRAATETFARTGYLESSMEQIAEVAGVSTAAVYFHFGGKQLLLASVLHTALDGLSAEIGTARSSGPADRTSLRLAVRAGWDWWRAHPDAAVLVTRYSEAARAPAAPEGLIGVDGAARSLTTRLVLGVILDSQAAGLSGRPLRHASAESLAAMARENCVRLILAMRRER